MVFNVKHVDYMDQPPCWMGPFRLTPIKVPRSGKVRFQSDPDLRLLDPDDYLHVPVNHCARFRQTSKYDGLLFNDAASNFTILVGCAETKRMTGFSHNLIAPRALVALHLEIEASIKWCLDGTGSGCTVGITAVLGNLMYGGPRDSQSLKDDFKEDWQMFDKILGMLGDDITKAHRTKPITVQRHHDAPSTFWVDKDFSLNFPRPVVIMSLSTRTMMGGSAATRLKDFAGFVYLFLQGFEAHFPCIYDGEKDTVERFTAKDRQCIEYIMEGRNLEGLDLGRPLDASPTDIMTESFRFFGNKGASNEPYYWCESCCKVAPAYRCTGCNCVRYCSQQHQKEDWPIHKAWCKEYVKLERELARAREQERLSVVRKDVQDAN